MVLQPHDLVAWRESTWALKLPLSFGYSCPKPLWLWWVPEKVGLNNIQNHFEVYLRYAAL